MPWVDIIVVAVILLMAVIGLFRGFFKTLLAFFGTLATLILAIFLSRYVSGFFEAVFGLKSALTSWLTPTVSDECADGVLSGVMLIFARILMGKSGYNIDNPDTVKSDEFVSAFSGELGSVIGTVITVIILFILLKILWFVLSKIFEKLTKSKIIGSLDKILGFVLGLLKGALAVFSVFSIIYLLSPVITPLGDLVQSLSTSNPVSYQLYQWATYLLDNVVIPWFGK